MSGSESSQNKQAINQNNGHSNQSKPSRDLKPTSLGVVMESYNPALKQPKPKK